jgi:hypothetical protein
MYLLLIGHGWGVRHAVMLAMQRCALRFAQKANTQPIK